MIQRDASGESILRSDCAHDGMNAFAGEKYTAKVLDVVQLLIARAGLSAAPVQRDLTRLELPDTGKPGV
jgi:hypothetical protein